MSKINISVLVSGGGTNLQALIDKTENGYIDQGRIAQVISSTKDAYALKRAEKHGIKSLYIGRSNFPDETLRREALLEALLEEQTGLVVLAGYMQILPSQIIQHYRNRIINIHPSLIPAFCGPGYYGEKVHAAVLASGASESGATVHYVDEGVDTGQIIMQEKVPVHEGDTAQSLAERVLKTEHRLLAQAVRDLCRTINEHSKGEK